MVRQDKSRPGRVTEKKVGPSGVSRDPVKVGGPFSQFVPILMFALMGMGLEGSNLDHAARFAAKFREFGDEEGASIQEIVAEEEVPHVRFAMHWFEEFTGSRDFDTWARHLPAPITPTMFWQEPVNERDRLRAGMDAEFIARLRQS